jgi:hypothetical protein
VELFYRLNHARQTLDFAKRQVGQRAGRGSGQGAAGTNSGHQLRKAMAASA